MRHAFRIQHLSFAAVITTAWLTMLILFFNPWMRGYHGIGGLLWAAGTYLSVLIAALAFLSHRKTLDISRSVNAVASRRYVYLRHFAADLASLNIIPFLIAAIIITLASTFMVGRGYLVWQYFLLVPLFLTLAILIGWINAYLFTHSAVGVVFSGLFSLSSLSTSFKALLSPTPGPNSTGPPTPNYLLSSRSLPEESSRAAGCQSDKSPLSLRGDRYSLSSHMYG